VLVWAWRGEAGDVSWPLRLPPLALVSFLLVQGALYWHVKLRGTRRRAPLPGWFCGAFRALRTSSRLGLALVLGTGVVSWLRRADRGGTVEDLAWAAGLLAFAALEYVNYYHRQLMHDSAADWRYLRRHRRLRPAPLATDLARCGAGARRSPDAPARAHSPEH
jgi:hypothetical protein